MPGKATLAAFAKPDIDTDTHKAKDKRMASLAATDLPNLGTD